jgi:putative ABC transport system permease protein
VARLPIAWLQLSHGRAKLLVAVLGVVFAVTLMWSQIGFEDALYDSATVVEQRLRGDIVVVHPQSEAMFRMKAFSRRLLYRVQGHPDVVNVSSFYTGVAIWRNPWNGKERSTFVFGVDPSDDVLDVEGYAAQRGALTQADVCLFDTYSRPDFGDVGGALAKGESVVTEINNRRFTVKGTVRIGASFAADGNIIVGDANFLRLFPNRKVGAIDVGVIRLRPGANARQVAAEIRAQVQGELQVLTALEFVAFEKAYWANNSPIGFIFSMGLAIGLFVGFIVVYQILYTDVTNHLPQYATLKAIGYTDGYLLRLVVEEAAILAVLGFIPGTLIAAGLFKVARDATYLPLQLSLDRGIQLFAMTLVMCCFSAAVAVRKLKAADPADVF